MALPFLLVGTAAVAGLAGLAKSGKAVATNIKAKDKIDGARIMYEEAKETMEKQRVRTIEQLTSLGETKLKSWSEDIGAFLDIYSEFKNVRLESSVNVDAALKDETINVDNLQEMQIAAIKASEIIKGGIGSLGAGALAGIASYGGAMLLASASTGTTIASLSGVAATNATLAWFGGGSLATGGFGMAGGTVVLGGIVVGPILAVAGFIMAAKSEESLAKAKRIYAEAETATEQMLTLTSFMGTVERLSLSYHEFIIKFRKNYCICARVVPRGRPERGQAPQIMVNPSRGLSFSRNHQVVDAYGGSFFPKRVVYSRSPHDGSEVVSQVHSLLRIKLNEWELEGLCQIKFLR